MTLWLSASAKLLSIIFGRLYGKLLTKQIEFYGSNFNNSSVKIYMV